MGACCAVLVIGFNRPDKVARLMSRIRNARPMRLYFSVDGAREGVIGEDRKCAAVRDCVRFIDWPCEVHKLFREQNLGCKNAVSSAVSWFFENEELGIILEDDCIPSLEFFSFASEMLERYKDDERVGAVCGFNHFNFQSDIVKSYHFSSHFDCWGWATWKRVWKNFHVDMHPYADNYRGIINGTLMTRYFKRMLISELSKCLSGTVNSWAYPFQLYFQANKWLCVVPRVRLVGNGGFFDKNATHTGGYFYFATEFADVGSIGVSLIHPEVVSCDEWADRMREQVEGGLFPRGLTWIGSKFPACRPFLSLIGDFLWRCCPWFFRFP